jgi:hypothetical protein
LPEQIIQRGFAAALGVSISAIVHHIDVNVAVTRRDRNKRQSGCVSSEASP